MCKLRQNGSKDNMAIGERIHFFRLLRGMTQKFLGIAVGFPEKSADVRMAQYETGTRTPKADMTAELAKVLDVCPQALNVPDIDTNIGLMHTLFALEDIYGLEVCESEGEVHLRVNVYRSHKAIQLLGKLRAWNQTFDKLKNGEITQEEYDRWRYRYPEFDTYERWVKIPPQELSDMLVEALKDNSENYINEGTDYEF